MAISWGYALPLVGAASRLTLAQQFASFCNAVDGRRVFFWRSPRRANLVMTTTCRVGLGISKHFRSCLAARVVMFVARGAGSYLARDLAMTGISGCLVSGWLF
jgi:hypothetical protein